MIYIKTIYFIYSFKCSIKLLYASKTRINNSKCIFYIRRLEYKKCIYKMKEDFMKTNVKFLILILMGSSKLFAANFSGYINAKIDSFTCEMNQNNQPELILKTIIPAHYVLMKDHNFFTSLVESDFCYDLSSYKKFFSENNDRVQIWLQTYQSFVFIMNAVDKSCGKYINEGVYIAVLNGIPGSRLTKSLPVYSDKSIFIENAPAEKCIVEADDGY